MCSNPRILSVQNKPHFYITTETLTAVNVCRAWNVGMDATGRFPGDKNRCIDDRTAHFVHDSKLCKHDYEKGRAVDECWWKLLQSRFCRLALKLVQAAIIKKVMAAAWSETIQATLSCVAGVKHGGGYLRAQLKEAKVCFLQRRYMNIEVFLLRGDCLSICHV